MGHFLHPYNSDVSRVHCTLHDAVYQNEIDGVIALRGAPRTETVDVPAEFRSMRGANPYGDALGIQVPRLELAKSSRDANYYSLLIVALLERGEPITLEEAAKRLEEAGAAPPGCALASLKRCKPARPPIYRDGDRYALDPHDHEADLWTFRLGLRPPQTPALQLVRPDPRPLPSADEALTAAAWTKRAARACRPDPWSLSDGPTSSRRNRVGDPGSSTSRAM